MPQIPLFVSSSQAEGAAQNGAFHVRFQPPLHVPEGAVDTRVMAGTIKARQNTKVQWHSDPVS